MLISCNGQHGAKAKVFGRHFKKTAAADIENIEGAGAAQRVFEFTVW